jgi:hypothetical protein
LAFYYFAAPLSQRTMIGFSLRVCAAAVAAEDLAHALHGKLNTPAMAFMNLALCGTRRLVVWADGFHTRFGNDHVDVAEAVHFLAVAPVNVSWLTIDGQLAAADWHRIVAALDANRCHEFLRRFEVDFPIDVTHATALLSATNSFAHLRSLQCAGAAGVILDVASGSLRRLALLQGAAIEQLDFRRMPLLRRVGPLCTLPDTITAVDLSHAQHLLRLDNDFCSSCSGLRDVQLPHALTEIGDRCLTNCDSLATLDLSGVTQLRAIGSCFGGNSPIRSVLLPRSVTTIDESFLIGTPVAAVDLSHQATLLSIGSWFLSDCASVSEVRLPNSVKSIGDGFLENCGAITAALDLSHLAELRIIGDSFASGCSLPDVRLPASVTSVGRYFISHCESITTTLDLSGLVLLRLIDDGFACNSTLTDARLPPGVTSIGDGFLRDCESISAVLDISHLTQLREIGDSFADGCSLPDVRLPHGVTSIGDDFLCDCQSMTSVLDLSNLTLLKRIGDLFMAGSSIVDVRLPPIGEVSIGEKFLWRCGNISLERQRQCLTEITTRRGE